ATSMENWQEVMPEEDSVTLLSMEAFDKFLAVFERANGLRQVRIIPLEESAPPYTIAFEDPAFTVSESANPDFYAEEVRFIYTSLVMPRETISYNMRTKNREVLKTEPIAGGYDPDQYISER